MTWQAMWCRSIAQGCSEYNITVLLDQRDAVRALRAVHGRFYLATLPMAVGVIGPGLVGRTFLGQLAAQLEACPNNFLCQCPYTSWSQSVG